jgi:hypothetical protein
MTCAAIFSGALLLRAQEAADADLRNKPTLPVASPTPAAGPTDVPELSRLDELFKQTSMGKAADTQRLRVKWRELKNKVANDADLIAMRRAAEKTRTDLEKRDRLRAFYKLYFTRVRQFPMSAEMKQYVDAMEAAQLGKTAQSHVRPSPTPSPAKRD